MALARFAPIVTNLGQAVLTALAGTPNGVPETFRACLLVPGAIAADGCDCGQLALAINRIYLSDNFPNEATGDQSGPTCGPFVVAANITVSLFRCVPSLSEDLTSPACTQLITAATNWDADVAAIRHAIACHLAPLADDEQIAGYVLGATTPVGPDGACLGADTAVTIGIDSCGCP